MAAHRQPLGWEHWPRQRLLCLGSATLLEFEHVNSTYALGSTTPRIPVHCFLCSPIDIASKQTLWRSRSLAYVCAYKAITIHDTLLDFPGPVTEWPRCFTSVRYLSS
jgi:hypothetical protein